MPGADVELTDVEAANVVQDRARSPEAEVPEPVCRICHDDLSAPPGHPVTLECACKGGLRAAHKRCALRWFRSRGDAVCEVCNRDTGLSLSREGDGTRRQRAPGTRGGRRVFSRDAPRRRERDPAARRGEDETSADASGDDSASAPDDDSALGGSDDETYSGAADDDARTGETAAFARRVRRRSERRNERRRGEWYRFFCGPIIPSTAADSAIPGSDFRSGSDVERAGSSRRATGRLHRIRRRASEERSTGGVSICDLAPLVVAVFVSQTLLLLSRAGDANPDGAVVTPGLAVALAYMNSGAHLLGIVQMLVGLSVTRLGRAEQVTLLWLWALAMGVGSWASFRKFMRPDYGAAGEGEDALVACVIVSVSAAFSPTLAFWVVFLARAVAGCGGE